MAADEPLPSRIGRFAIRAELGRGAMGVVYEGHDPTLDRPVALKAIRIAGAGTDTELKAFEERFLTEARAVARLSHPGIVVVHEVGRDPESGTLFMALERLRGRTLAQHLAAARAPLEWRDALRLVAGVARALHCAHGQGIVHRDIKPANIMVLEGGEPKVMDFGIAKLQASHAQLTSTGQYLGTPLYMSPEQALGQPVDGRSDLFSLGAVLYQLVTGVRLFEADSVPRIMTRVAYEPARPPSELSSGLPPGVDAIVMRALAKDPDQRYPDGASLAEDIDLALAGRPLRHVANLPIGELTAVSQRPALPPSVPAPSPPAEVAPTVGGVAARPERPAARHEAPRSSRLGGRAMAAALFLAGIATAAALSYFGLLRPQYPAGAQGPAGSRPARATSSTPDAGPSPAPRQATTPSAGAALTPGPAGADAPAELLVDFRHHYRSGRVRVWVDRQLLFDRQLGGKVAADVAGVKIRRGYVEARLEVAPGRREVMVQVDWDDNSRNGTLVGFLDAGRARRLEIRIDRFLKKMSLEWN